MAVRLRWLQSIRTRLITGGLALAVVPVLAAVGALAWYVDRQAEASLTERALSQLDAIRAAKSAEIGTYFADVSNLVQVLAANEQVRGAMRELPAQFLAMRDSVVPDEARATLGRYYAEEFGRQYAARNGVVARAAADIPATLPLESLAAQHLYIATNPNPLGQKNNFERAADGSAYADSHARLQPFARKIYEKYGFYDIFLIEPQSGYVVYTFFKELDFGTSLTSGPWANTGLAEAFVAARDATDAGAVAMSDYKPYTPSYEDQAAFVGTRIMDGERLLGVLVVQLPIDRINAVVTFGGKWKDVGLGASGEIYMVGADHLPRSISRFVMEDRDRYLEQIAALGATPDALASIRTRGTNVGAVPMRTQGIDAALRGEAGRGVFPDYRNIPVMSSYAPIDVMGHSWSIMAEIDEAEALEPVVSLRRNVLLMAGAILLGVGLLAAIVALRLARSINQPLAVVQRTVQKVAGGDLEARAKLGSQDEIGELARAFDGMLDDKVSELARAARENDELNHSVIAIMQSLAKLSQRDLTERVPVTADVTGSISDAINLMAGETTKALKRVNLISEKVALAAGQMRGRSDEVQKVAQATGGQVASASAELEGAARAMRDIADQANQANTNAERAISATKEALEIVRSTVEGISASRDQIRETEKRIKRLGERSTEIASVVGIINQIAERTSVLALNASMQAVVAGDAGRGFAVVADEVKRLAENARQATQQIALLVNAIQADTTEATQAMNGTIAQVVDISRMAERAGGQMTNTRAATEQLVSSVQAISSTTATQAQVSDSLLSRARQLTEANTRTREELDRQGLETLALADSANELLATVSLFRLPA